VATLEQNMIHLKYVETLPKEAENNKISAVQGASTGVPAIFFMLFFIWACHSEE